MPRVQKFVEEEFPDEHVPPLSDLIKNTALQINHGILFMGDGLRPVHPHTIHAGLVTCHPPPPLTGSLKDWVEEAEDGVIFVSFGSIIKASKMPEEKRLMMLTVFGRLKQRVVWKWDEVMSDAPHNVLISSWLPQPSLLAHNNVKVFVSHGGAGSMQETICHKTPIVGVPIHGDQYPLTSAAVEKGFGVQLDWKQITEESLIKGIKQILDDSSYQESVSSMSELIMDQPQHPLDKTVWWLEYLLRYKIQEYFESNENYLKGIHTTRICEVQFTISTGSNTFYSTSSRQLLAYFV